MAKTKISEWSATPSNNTDIDGINIAEGCAPSGINDAIREMMSQIKDWQAGTSGDYTAVSAGGTGVGTLTGIVKGNGTSAFSAATAGTDYVTPTGTETLTNKTVEAGVFTNGYTEESFTSTPTSTITLDLANGSVQIITLGGNVTYTFPTPVAGKSFTLVQKQDGTGSRTVTWPASVKWPAGTAPTVTSTASKADKFVFTAIDSSSWLGSVAGQNYTV
jgi:hypothetical protein